MAAVHYPGTPGTILYGGRAATPPGGETTYPPNELRVSLPSGTQTDYPLQFGRAFPPGAVTGEPQVSLDGAVMATQQADVKTRHADGSVKFAVISVVIPSLGTTERVLSIANKSAGVRTAETTANMLANYDFGASIDVKVGGASVTGAPVNARAYLQTLTDATLLANTVAHSPDSRYWTQGPVCTTVILCDHTGKSLDFGTTAAKAHRPIFYVEFWPTLGRYKVRYVIENADVTKLRGDTGMDVIFTAGNASPVEKLNQSAVAMAAATWQSREYWAGAAYPQANINHGLAYLAAIQVLPNFDTSITMHTGALASYASYLAAMDKSLGSAGGYTKSMGTTGGRPDLGVFNKWETVLMYSGAAHMHEFATKHCEFAGSWPIYWREGATGKTFIDATPALGRIVTRNSRPTQRNGSYTNDGTVASVDRFTYDGSAGDPNGWEADNAHFPSMYYVSYLLGGSPFWYEKAMQIAGWGTFWGQGVVGYNSLSAGDAPTRLVLHDVQTRGFAWQYRNRVRAWWMSLDGSPEKALMQKAMDEATAARCGIHGVDEFIGDPIREAWNTNQATFWGASRITRPNAMGFLSGNDGYNVNDVGGAWPTNSDQSTNALWMINFCVSSLAHAVELGYTKAAKLRDFAARAVLRLITSEYPRMATNFGFPSGKTDKTFYQSPEELFAAWPGRTYNSVDLPATSANGFEAGGAPGTWEVYSFNYGNHAAYAVASANGDQLQAAAWAFLLPYHQNNVYYNHDPRTAVLPRT